MRTISALLILIALVGCAGQQRPNSGSGAVTLNYPTTLVFKYIYLRHVKDRYFLITKTGTAGMIVMCRSDDPTCDLEEKLVSETARCREIHHTECLLFAAGKDIVWDGEVIFASLPPLTTIRKPVPENVAPTRKVEPRDTMKGFSDLGICQLIASPDADWETSNASAEAIAEAKKRNLTPQHCYSRLEGRKRLQANRDARASFPTDNFRLCAQALHEVRHSISGWDSIKEKYAEFVAEARRRGLSADDCGKIVADGSKHTQSGSARFEDLSDRAVCTLAVQGGAWRTGENDAVYVQEAKARGLTPETCP